MKNEYQFYEMMGYPVPFQRDFFGYFSDENDFLGGEPLDFSRGKPNPSLTKIQEQVKATAWIWKLIPYVEMVYLTGKASFNAPDEELPCGFWIVTSQKRMRSTYIVAKSLFFFLNIRYKKKGRPILSIDAIQDETDLDIHGIKEQEFDIMPIYQLAHLSIIYQKFEQYSWSLYKENIRIKEYLPNFPLQFVIACGIDKTMGKYSFTSFIEKICGNRFGDAVNYLSKKITLLFFVLIKKTTGTSIRVLDSLIRRDIRNKDKQMLVWKVLRKK